MKRKNGVQIFLYLFYCDFFVGWQQHDCHHYHHHWGDIKRADNQQLNLSSNYLINLLQKFSIELNVSMEAILLLLLLSFPFPGVQRQLFNVAGGLFWLLPRPVAQNSNKINANCLPRHAVYATRRLRHPAMPRPPINDSICLPLEILLPFRRGDHI